MAVSYSEVIARRAQITSRIPPRYMPGRSWDPLRDRRVLSLGCGSVEGEQFKELLAVSAGAEGVDTDPKSGAKFRTLSEVPSGEFNALVAEHVLEHLTHEQVLSSFKQAARILPAGSVVIITLPNVSNFGSWFSNFDHKNFSPPEDIAAILELHGFQVMDMFGWSKPGRYQRHLAMGDQERALCAFMEENWGLTLPQYITIGAVRA